MAMTDAQKRYQNSEKGKAARARYQAKKKALKSQVEPKVETETKSE